MFCPNCGKDLPENAAFCPECGKKVEITKEQIFSQNTQPEFTSPFDNGNYQGEQPYGFPQEDYVNPDAGKVDFKTAIKLFFQNYANFETRATKTEYWWAVLFEMLVSGIAGAIPFSTQFDAFSGEFTINYLSSIVSLALFIPSLAVAVRRLHDTGKKWTYMFINLIPVVGWILYIIQLCKDSDEDNQWGPKAR